MSWKASSDTNRLTEATQVVHQGIPGNQGGRVAVDACCGDRLRLPGLQFHRVAGVDEVFGVNMLKVIEASTAPHLEPGEPQDERIQHLVSVLGRGLLRAGAGGTQAIVAGPLLQSPNDLLARDHRLTLWPGDGVREPLPMSSSWT